MSELLTALTVLFGFALASMGILAGLLILDRLSRGHRQTDPVCVRYRQPTNRLARWRFDRHRGRSCPVCWGRFG